MLFLKNEKYISEMKLFDFYSTEKLFDWIQMRSETKKTHQGGKPISETNG